MEKQNKRIDVDALMNDVDALSVAEYVGIEVVKKGSRYALRCPGHFQRLGKEDAKIGNCVLTQHGYHCYACGKTVSVFGMVMEHLGCNYPEALKIVAEASGGIGLYLSDETNEQSQKKLSLSKDDLSIIGLATMASKYDGKYITNFQSTQPELETLKEDEMWAKDDNGYIVYKRYHSSSLQRLLNENETEFKNLISRKAMEAKEKYKKAIELCGSRDSKCANIVCELFNVDNCTDKDIFNKVTNILQMRVVRCEEIYNEYG